VQSAKAMMRPKKNKEAKVKLTKDSWRKAARFLKYLKPYEDRIAALQDQEKQKDDQINKLKDSIFEIHQVLQR
jgi:hypothetical protein